MCANSLAFIDATICVHFRFVDESDESTDLVVSGVDSQLVYVKGSSMAWDYSYVCQRVYLYEAVQSQRRKAKQRGGKLAGKPCNTERAKKIALLAKMSCMGAAMRQCGFIMGFYPFAMAESASQFWLFWVSLF